MYARRVRRRCRVSCNTQPPALPASRLVCHAVPGWYITWDPTQSPRESPQGLDVCKARARRVSGANQLGGGLDTSQEVPEGRTANGVAVSHPLQWSSEYHDTETALIYYNYRYYNPTDGRWTRRDPIGIEGGINFLTNKYNAYPYHDYIDKH